MKTSKPRAVGNSLADLKKLQHQVRRADQPTPEPARPQRRQRPRPPDPGQKPTRHRLSALQATPEPASALAPEDLGLLQRSLRDVAPLKKRGSSVTLSRPAATAELLEQRRRHAVGEPIKPPALPAASDQYVGIKGERNDRQHLRPGCGTDVLRDLERNRWPIESSLDLHGADLEQARDRLDNFLRSCLEHGVRCVRIVHGAGYGSRDGEPVLKHTVRRWLTQLPSVLAFMECAPNEGGDGAVKLVLQAPPPGQLERS
ncbi:MAG TPA: Smr/MutS family protein [Alcaligenes faecalis]|nr:Smr/MutS family protein [Alcaligenes faecalis]